MYVTLICFAVASLIFLIFGKSFLLFFYKQEEKNYSFSDSFFIGLCLVGTILNIWSLFLPTNIFALLFLLLSSVFLVYKNHKLFTATFKSLVVKFKSEKVFSLLILLSVLIILLYSVGTPKNYDSYLYHINAIQWNEFYRAVPGLANFHDRFGFNSSMFVLSAGFSFTEIYNQYIFIISSLTFTVFFIWLLQYIYFKKGITGLFCLLFLYYFTKQYGLDISSPATDLLPNLLVGYVLISLLFENDALKKKALLFIIVPLFCITIKISTFPVVLLSLFAIYSKNLRPVKSLIQFALFGCLFVLPWIIKNVILTGYIIYPMAQLDFFNFDWEVTKESVIDIRKWVASWARIPFKNNEVILAMSFNEWFPIWWKAALPVNQILFILSAISPLVFTVYFFVTKKIQRNVLLFVGVAFLSFLFWFFSAPDFRFSFTPILLLALFPLLILKSLFEKNEKWFNPALSLGLIFSLYLIGINGYELFSKEYRSLTNVSKYAYLPNDVSTIKEKSNIKFNRFVFITKKGKKIELFEPNPNHLQCFDKFPCSWFVGGNLELRGEDLQDGFKIK